MLCDAVVCGCRVLAVRDCDEGDLLVTCRVGEEHVAGLESPGRSRLSKVLLLFLYLPNNIRFICAFWLCVYFLSRIYNSPCRCFLPISLWFLGVAATRCGCPCGVAFFTL